MINYEEMTEEEYLAHCKTLEFSRPCVTVDMLIFSMNKEQQLELLLIKRGGHPFKGKWAIPGGFVEMDESLEEAAARELKEETNLEGIYLEQLYTFGDVDRDKRARVISVAYLALVPGGNLDFSAGDDAVDACSFVVRQEKGNFTLLAEERGLVLTEKDLAFDHKDMIYKGLERLKGKVIYSDIALELLRDKEKFTIYELQTIYEALTGEDFDVANFRRSFKKKFINTGRVEKLEEKSVDFSRKPSSYYRLLETNL